MGAVGILIDYGKELLPNATVGSGEEAPVSTAYHVVFRGSARSETVIDGLCADNPFELGWYDELPVVPEESDHIADVRLFLE